MEEDKLEIVKDEPIKVEGKQKLWSHLFTFLGIFACSAVISLIVMSILYKTGDISLGFSAFMSYVIQMGVALIFLTWNALKNGYKVRMRWSLKGFDPTLIMLGVTLLLMTNIALEPLMSLLPESWLETIDNMIQNGGNLMLITTIVIAPIMEEVIFRGIIQGVVTSRYGPLLGVTVSAAVFGVIHVIPQQVIFGVIAGLILGYIYHKRGSLFSVIIIHMINNTIAYLTIKVFDLGGVGLNDIIQNQTMYWAIYSVCSLLLIVVIIALMRQLSPKIDNIKE